MFVAATAEEETQKTIGTKRIGGAGMKSGMKIPIWYNRQSNKS